MMASTGNELTQASIATMDWQEHTGKQAIGMEGRDSVSQSSLESGILEKKKEEVIRNSFADVDDASVACGDINFKSLNWWQCGMLMIAETISLGILSLPSVLDTVGLVPGFILILGLGICASYSGYTIGQFKEAYPHVQSMADAFEILCTPLGFPRVGREIGGAGQIIFLVFSMASHVLTWVICLNTLTNHSTCNIVWGVVALVVFWLFDLPRTLKSTSYLSVASFFSVFTAVLITMVAVGINDPGTGAKTYGLWPDPSVPLPFYKAFLSVTNIVFAYAGHVAFFGFISEMKNPRDFPKALALLQVADITMYIVTAVVVYRYVGHDVASPALSAAGPTVQKVAYGIAIPTIIIAGVIYGHIASKQLFMRIFGAQEMGKRTTRAYLQWAGITFVLWAIAFVIAESIPNFNDLLGVVSSLFASWFTYGVSGIFWLFINKGKWFSTPIKTFLTFVNWFLVILGATICGVGLYASAYTIHISDGKIGAWSCGSAIL